MAGAAVLVSLAISRIEPISASVSSERPASTSCNIDVLCAPTASAPAMRLSIETRKVTPSFCAISCASFIMVAARSRVSANWQISTSVACVSAEIGLKERLPHALSQISERISGSTMDLSPALMKTSCNCFTRGIDHAADEAAGVDMLGQHACGIEALQPLVIVLAAEPLEVPPRQAVLHREHDGVGAEQAIDVAHDLFEEMRLHRQHDDVLLAGLGRLVHGLHLGGLDLAVVPFELEAVLLDRSQMRALVDDGDVVARERNLGRQQAADGAGADHADLLRFGWRAQQIRAR